MVMGRGSRGWDRWVWPAFVVCQLAASAIAAFGLDSPGLAFVSAVFGTVGGYIWGAGLGSKTIDVSGLRMVVTAAAVGFAIIGNYTAGSIMQDAVLGNGVLGGYYFLLTMAAVLTVAGRQRSGRSSRREERLADRG